MKNYDFSILNFSALATQSSSYPSPLKKNPTGLVGDVVGWLLLVLAVAVATFFIWVASRDALPLEIIQQTPYLLGIILWVLLMVIIFRPLLTGNSDDPVKRFAEDNGLFLATNKEAPDEFEGILFNKGEHKHQLFLSDRRIDPAFFVADYVFENTIGPDKFEEYKVLSLRLPEITTPFIIDSKANNVLLRSNLPSGKEVSEILDLEGDFGEYFQLYCVKNQQQAVLEILTPEVMALLIDNFSDYDLEVWKDRLYAYKKGEFSYEGYELPDAFTLLARLQKEFAR